MSLTVAEKRPQQRNGGSCVGIFFQFFSKKKLSSKKLLLPPAKLFGADDKTPMAKFLLIADENRGGFPKLDPELSPAHENRMQAPGIVARLMGLESMPVVHHEKPRKALDSKFCDDNNFEHSRLDQGLCVDSGGNAKGELRPQKLQKTGGGFLEQRPVEAFHKGLIYGSRRKPYWKLETPVKSPRLLSRCNTSRLVQVANKILEPGLQSRSRAKCAVTFLGSLDDGREGDREGLSDSVSGSCKSCCSSVGVKDGLADECGSSGLDLSFGSEESKKIKSPVILSGQRKNGSPAIQSKLKAEEVYKTKAPVVPSRQIKNGSLAIQAKLNVESKSRYLMERKKHVVSTGDQYGKAVIRNGGLRQAQLLPVGDKVVGGTKISSVRQTKNNLNELNRAKNFVTLNKNINNYTRSRSSTKVSGCCRGELEGDGLGKNVARKRSPTNRNAEAFGCNVVKERSVRNNVMSRKGTRLISNHSINESCIRSNLPKVDCNSFIESNNNGIVSFTFNSPMRQDSRSTTHEGMTRDRTGQGELKYDDASHLKKFMSNEKVGSLSSQKGMALRGDELSSLLEEKIKELSSLNMDELGRSTASILEELISALKMGTPEIHKNRDNCSDMSIQTEINVYHNHMSNTDKEFQNKAQSGTTAAYLAGGSEQPSPASILEASFSNDSCSLGSFNGCSESKPQLGLPEMCDITQSSDMDSDLLDSATSLNISQSLICEVGDGETELGTAGEAISDAELLFENISLYGSDRMQEFSLDSFLLDTLESITDNFHLNFKLAKEGIELREFLFDCIMECLDSKFGHFCRSGFRAWLKLPLVLNRDRLMREVNVEIRGWRDLAGKATDDLVEKEMKGSNLKWTECETEVFETGVEIQTDMLQALIDEMVVDLR